MTTAHPAMREADPLGLAGSPLFEAYDDPQTGVRSYLLTRRVAPLQQTFYFVNDSSGADRYFWFYCAFPPGGSGQQGRSLGVIDFETHELRHFPETQFGGMSPWVDPDTGEAYWSSGPAIWRRGAQPNQDPQLINQLPQELVGRRWVRRLAVHLSRTADGRAFFCDSQVGLQYLFGTLPVDGSDYQLWHRFDRNHNHAQASPTDPDQVLFAQEFHDDQLTGQRLPIQDRMWLLRRGQTPRPLFEKPTILTHEWWDADGKHAWACGARRPGQEGVWRMNIDTGQAEHIWQGHRWHAHSDATSAYLIGDRQHGRFFRGCASEVHFFNIETQREVRLIDNPEHGGVEGSNYHIDPHPRFCFGDRYVAFTTTVRGCVDVALTPVAPLIEATN